jgi:EAL domain-containing protein (putative c-di-GMP-specific phosphodiesterase class I)/GGDEF domain-containing protein
MLRSAAIQADLAHGLTPLLRSDDTLPMPADALIEGFPDLVVLVRRDGTVLAVSGGHGVADLKPAGDAIGQRIEAVWRDSVAGLVRQLTRKAIALRTTTEARFQDRGRDYDARVSAQGPDRAICVIRAMLAGAQDGALDATDERPRPQLDRRGFLRRFKESMSMAALHEKSIAVAVVHVDGIADIAQIIAPKVSEQLMSTAILRLPAQFGNSVDGDSWWYLGQLSDSLLALVFETSDRDAIDACVSRVCASLREPVSIGQAEFHLTPYAGVAVLGQDASSPKLLLDHARSAATEARRSGSTRVCFFTDTLRLQSLARLDIARELGEAIENRDIRLRYVGRHDLETGRLVAWVGYLRWVHPFRGEIRPDEFLRVAETTGLATALSRAVLMHLRQDFAARGPRSDADVRISFGALRHHILHEDFVADVERLLAEGAVPAERLELRISEKALIARDPADFNSLQQRGVRIVVDEVGRGMGSLDWLARAPIWGLQLDRAWATALRSDEVALRVCRAGISMAIALGLTPIATGVDDQEQRDALLALGCRHGTGDLYPNAVSDITENAAPDITERSRAATSI